MSKSSMEFLLESLSNRGKTVGTHLDVFKVVLSELVGNIPSDNQKEIDRKCLEHHNNELSGVHYFDPDSKVSATDLNILKDALVAVIEILLDAPR